MHSPNYTRKVCGDIIVWYNNTGELDCIYVDDGATAVPITEEMKARKDDFEALVHYIQSLNVGRKKENYMCCVCGRIFPNPPQLTHFAGLYCRECAEEYKRNNSQRCLLCGKPYYLCVC